MLPISDKTSLLLLLNRNYRKYSPGGLNWKAVLKLAEYSRVNALLFDKIKDMREELSVPDGVYDELKDIYRSNAVRNTFILEASERLREALDKEGLSCILMKGICIVNTISRERIGARIMGDTDILAKETDVEKFDSVLRSLGHALPPSDLSYLDGMARRRKAAMYFKRGEPPSMSAPVHLHWHIVNVSRPFLDAHWSKIDMDAIWKEATRLRPGDGTFLIMSPEHMLISMAVHGFNHGFSRIDLIYDMHSCVLEYGRMLDWQKILELASRWHADMPLRMGLYLSKKMFDTPIEESAFKDLYRKGPSIIERWHSVYSYYCRRPKEDASAFLYYARSRGISGKAGFLASAIRLKFLSARD